MNRPTSLLEQLAAHGRAQNWRPDWLAPFRMAEDSSDWGAGVDDGDDDAKGSQARRGGASSGQAGGQSRDGDFGFPANTAVAEMTTEQQVAYWRHHAQKHEKAWRAKAGDMSLEALNDLREKARQFDSLAEASKTEHERALEVAKQEATEAGRRDERAKAIPRLVDAEIKAAAAGRVDQEQLKNLLEPLDRTKFLDSDGEVDEQKVATFISSVLPANGNGNGGRTIDFGQGRRQDPPKGSVKNGADLYAQRHPART